MCKDKITVNELLRADDVKAILEEVNKDHEKIERLIVIYTTKDDKMYWMHTQDSLMRIIGMLEVVKTATIDEIMEGGGEEELEREHET